jgi:translation elongation factor EF-4
MLIERLNLEIQSGAGHAPRVGAARAVPPKYLGTVMKFCNKTRVSHLQISKIKIEPLI